MSNSAETQSQKWNRLNRERRNEIARQYRERNKEKLNKKDINRDLERNYGITLDDYENLAKDQNYLCRICGTNNYFGRTRFAVDHCHKTGKIRGLLCTKCNVGLGMFNDDPQLLIQALSYLKETI